MTKFWNNLYKALGVTLGILLLYRMGEDIIQDHQD